MGLQTRTMVALIQDIGYWIGWMFQVCLKWELVVFYVYGMCEFYLLYVLYYVLPCTHCMWTLTFGAGWAAPGQLKCVTISAERLLLVAVQKFLQWAKAPLGTTQNVLSWLSLHNLTVLTVHHSFILKIKWKIIQLKLCWSCFLTDCKSHTLTESLISNLQLCNVFTITRKPKLNLLHSQMMRSNILRLMQ